MFAAHLRRWTLPISRESAVPVVLAAVDDPSI
jgi:hypothetical protein